MRIVVLLALAVLCAPKVVRGDEASAAAALESAIERWESAFVAGDAETMASLTTDDFILLPPRGTPIRGMGAARDHGRKVAGSDILTMSITLEDAIVDGSLAYAMGTFRESSANGLVTRQGMFIDVWKRVDGSWRIHRHALTDTMPPRAKGIEPVPIEDQPVPDSPEPR